MNAGVLEAIDNLVHSIYTVDQTGLMDYFMSLIDEMDIFIKRMADEGYQVDLTQELLRIQEAFTKKDYVMLSDILLDEVKPEFEGITL